MRQSHSAGVTAYLKVEKEEKIKHGNKRSLSKVILHSVKTNPKNKHEINSSIISIKDKKHVLGGWNLLKIRGDVKKINLCKRTLNIKCVYKVYFTA